MKLRFGTISRLAGLAIYTVLFGELFLRLFAPQPILPRYVSAAPWGVRMNTPSVVYRQWTPEVDIQIRINKQGLRADRNFSERKPRGVCRIALLGDSYFLGFESSLEASFAERLEIDLRQAAHPVEVLNFAVSGHGTAEMLLTFDGYARQFAPDLVVAQWHSSDWADNMRSGLFDLEEGHLHRTGATYLPATGIQAVLLGSPAYRWLAENSQVYNAMRDSTARMVKRMLVAVRDRRQRNGAEDGSDDNTAPVSAQVKLSIALIRELRRHVEAAGAQFMMVDIPRWLNRQTFKSNFASLPATLTSNPAFVSPLSVFDAAAGAETKIYTERGNHHLTALGNRLLADFVAKTIDTGPWSTRCGVHIAM